MNNYKLGSLFDGSGGFPLAGTLCGIEPVWAAEVEPYPIAVTRSRFPRMKHLGDISKVNGAEIEPVDIITFGSPCQDLSVAGKRAGLKHEANGDEETTRSGLFMEAVRIIKEMRNATNGKYPTFALWENVPGAFSSNKGEDFRIVCEELIKIVEPTATMPEVPQKGWNYADSYVGDGWSLAYRVLDAQYWGVPQRRRRIYLVADFRAQRAREVLFEREGLRGYFTQGRTPWQGAPTDAKGGARADDREGEGFDGYNGDLTGDKSSTLGVNCGLSTGRNGVIERGRQLDDVAYTLKIRSGCDGGGKGALVQKDKSATIATNNDQYLFQPITDSHILDDQGGQQINVRADGKAPTLRAEAHGNVPSIVTLEPGIAAREGGHIYESVSGTLRANAGDNQMSVAYGIDHVITTGGNCTAQGTCVYKNIQATLKASGPHAVAYSVENHPADSRVNLDESGKVQTLTSRMGTGGGNVPMVMESKCYDVRFTSTGTKNARGHCYETDIARCIDTGHNSPDTNHGGITVVMKEPCAGTSGNNQPVICLQGNGIDRADNAGCNGKGWKEDTSYTLNTIDRPAVAYGLDRASFNQGQNAKFDFTVTEESQPTLTARGPGAVAQPIYNASKASFFMRATENGSADTLVATDYKDPQLVAYGIDPGASRDVGDLFIEEQSKTLTNGSCPGHHNGVVISDKPHYIVRRLTPTECARLQGFADRWGDIDALDRMSAEEYEFWKEVRNTHAAINGKKVQDYTVKQMLTWYNKLQTDSSEYKMWGNGIALPTALYVMQGIIDMLDALEMITDELNGAEELIEDWML